MKGIRVSWGICDIRILCFWEDGKGTFFPLIFYIINSTLDCVRRFGLHLYVLVKGSILLGMEREEYRKQGWDKYSVCLLKLIFMFIQCIEYYIKKSAFARLCFFHTVVKNFS